jgi:hypothetical protein
MSFDAHKNFAKATVSLGYTSAATSIVLIAGGGARMPAVPFNAVWWNATDYPDPADDPLREIIRVTARSTETLTIVRAQESTTAVAHNTPAKDYKLVAGLTLKSITDIESANGFRPLASAVPAANGELSFEATSNTTITVRFKGSDGTVRAVALTLS